MLLVDPRAPMLLLLLTAMLTGTAALLLGVPKGRWGLAWKTLRALSRGAGLLSGALAAALVAVSGYALGAQGLDLVLVWLGAALIFLALGVYLPGLDTRRHAARARRLEGQAVDFTGYMIAMLNSSHGDAAILREYVRRPRAQVADVQALIAEALDTHTRAGRGSIFDILHTVAERSGSVALRELSATIRQIARQDRTQVIAGLAEQRRRQMEIQIAIATRQAGQRENIVMLTSAGALFFGMLLFILYVMTGGGTLLHLF